LQAPAETDASVITCRNFKKPPPLDWLIERTKAGDRVGFDPKITPMTEAKRWRAALEKAGASLVAVDPNPIDALWTDQPGDPFSPAVPQPLTYAGETSEEKRRRVGEALAARGADATVLNQLDAIAWLLNVRGADTPSTPLVQSFLILAADGHATWFVDPLKLVDGMVRHLGNGVTLRPLVGFGDGLLNLAGKTVSLEAETATAWIDERLREAGATLVTGIDPTTFPRARKNPTELASTRAAHRRDGAAMSRFLCWFDDHALGCTEMQLMQKLEDVRGADPLHRGPSFTTIAGAGPNGAIVHYRSTPATDRAVEAGTFLLLDSGAQYLDGTTDITRTIPVGQVPMPLKRDFTLVLKGHIAVATARFPLGAVGTQIDALARQHLWKAGKDFDHGTGHGVGVYLGVHEGPARISPLGSVALEPGMILSNEPGYYVTGSHGIRIENLIVVREAKAAGFLEFETITFVPIDRRAIVAAMLTEDERAWIDSYHDAVWRKISPSLEGRERAWLRRMTNPLPA
jgi:Xaa-Pro aminopeptidase